MRVLHVDTALSWRGGQNQVLLAARGMAARGHAVAVACRRGGVLETRLQGSGIDTFPIGVRGEASPLGILGLARAFRAFGPEVAQLHDPHAVTAGLLAARLHGGARLIATRRVDFPLRGALSRRKYMSCRRVVAVSRAVAGVLEAGGVDGERIRVVYEGVPDRPPAAGGAEALAALGVPAGCRVVGNVAALADHKDHATLLESAPAVLRGVPEACFVIVGEGELRPRLEARARELGMGQRWIFAGFRSDLDRLLPAFAIFCLSSHQEGLGTSLLDAMNFALPIVATAAGGIPEAVEDGVTGRLVPPRDPEALAQALASLLRDPERRAAMGEAGRRRFEARFSDERMVGETLRVFEEA